MIPVTKPFLPELTAYNEKLQGIWKRNWLTNHGPLVSELELSLKDYLNVPHLLFLNNGTFALQLAIKALDLKGEVITTPFSYVATCSSIVWELCKPVFVDIEKEGLTLDPAKIEQAITPQTTAILATHVFGNPCNIEAIQLIANKHNLRVIYDAAHCFGVKYQGKSIFRQGDISTTSFHATKLFHTVEGGAVFTESPELLRKMSLLGNFGHVTPSEFNGAGVNGKNSEFHAAMGLVNLTHIETILEKRRILSEHYDKKLKDLHVIRPKIRAGTEYNYAYYAVLFESEKHLLKQMEELAAFNIQTRRYFYPSLSSLDYVGNQTEKTPIANDISKRVLCLPLFHSLDREEIDLIARIMLRTKNYSYKV